MLPIKKSYALVYCGEVFLSFEVELQAKMFSFLDDLQNNRNGSQCIREAIYGFMHLSIIYDSVGRCLSFIIPYRGHNVDCTSIQTYKGSLGL